MSCQHTADMKWCSATHTSSTSVLSGDRSRNGGLAYSHVVLAGELRRGAEMPRTAWVAASVTLSSSGTQGSG